VKPILFILLIVFPACSFGQDLLAKNISISLKEGTTGELLELVNKQTGNSISYSSNMINLEKRVKLNGDESTVEEFLRSILKGQPVKFVEENNKIYLVPVSPKKKYTLSGYVIEQGSGERLIGASLFFPSLQAGTTTNAYGFFSITLPEDETQIQVSHIGYQPLITLISIVHDTVLKIGLEKNIVLTEAVVVSSASRKNVYNSTSGKSEVTPGFIKSLPAIMGEADVLRSLQFLPGIQSGNEGASGLNVRGGSSDQNLILLDGVPVYNASHAFGLFSIFNGDVVNHVDVLKSAFPASYGGRLSSVIDVRLKEGDLQHFHGEGGIGLLFSKLTLEGPIKKGKASFLVSARRTYLDLIMRSAINSTDGVSEVAPFFTDINVKINFAAGTKDHFYVSVYTGQDKFKVKENFETTFDTLTQKKQYSSEISWGNLTAMGRWNHVFSKQLFSNFTLTHSRYRFNLYDNEQSFGKDGKTDFESRQHYFSGIRDWTLKADFDYLPAPRHYIKTGFSATLHSYRPGVSNFYQKDSVERINTIVDNQSSLSGEYDLYLEDDIRINARFKMNAGLRMSAFGVKTTLFSSVQPRLNLLYRAAPRWTMKAAYSNMNQFIHLLTNSSIGMPTDLWLPVTERVPPQGSHQFSTGIFYRISNSMETSLEGYFKLLQNVIDYSEGYGFSNAYEPWENMVETGKGKTRGIEWMIQKTKGRFTGMLCYTFSKSDRTFHGINEGKTFPYKYDKPHEVKTSVVWQPNPKFEFSSSWIYSTGNAISLPVAYYFNPSNNSYIDIYKGRNNFRMPDYHRLDVAFKFIKEKKHYMRTWSVNIYNAYNHFNPFFRYKTFDENNNIVFKDVAVFPLMPSISYLFKF
jgi:outer membrane receptor for ferrienterochelin and colicin